MIDSDIDVDFKRDSGTVNGKGKMQVHKVGVISLLMTKVECVTCQKQIGDPENKEKAMESSTNRGDKDWKRKLYSNVTHLSG